MKKITIAIIIVILLSFLIAGYAYQVIEEDTVATHWDSEGNVNGYMSKLWGLFLLPLISVGIYLLFLFIPKIDPLKKNIQKFRKDFDLFILMILLFLLYISIITTLANMDYVFNMTTMLLPAIGLLFYYIGSIMKKFKRNWFIGIRTPWTLSSDEVWKKTHKLASILFKITGVIILLGIFFPPKYLTWFILIPTFTTVILVVVYSYLEYKKIK
jgi:uncharacterized membrane protein